MVYAEGRNEDCAWHEFDPQSYLKTNYAVLRDEDRQIVELVRDFFGQHFANERGRAVRRGIDVGTGANLYPALTMLPFCDRITLYEYSEANLDWLARQRTAHWPTWRRVWARYWRILAEHPGYAGLPINPKAALARRAKLLRGSVFDLGTCAQRWDIGTMFFVAESITSQPSEFVSAVDNFIDALRPGAPFAVAFMEHSSGYQVAGKHFPAVSISRDDVRRCLDRRASKVVVERIDGGQNPLRDGYTGTIVACGLAGGTRDAGRPGQSQAPSRDNVVV